MSYLRQHLDYCFIVSVWLVWAVVTCAQGLWHLFADNWFMSITMACGSFVAGATSQGGGAVAFPVMTLIFGIEPDAARDFSMMIQSVGMTSAAVAIWFRRIKVETNALIYSGIGGAAGMLIGLVWIQDWFEPDPTKIFFVALWLAFGVALIIINRHPKAAKLERIPNPTHKTKALLFLTGICGGMVSGLLGSGLDILVFAFLVLGFRICEKVATPTSVILMAGNSLAGFMFRLWFRETGPVIEQSTWNYWWVCVPVVAFGAPFGAKFISKRGRHFIVRLLIFVIFAQFITAIIVVPFDRNLVILAVTTFVLGSVAFKGIYHLNEDKRIS